MSSWNVPQIPTRKFVEQFFTFIQPVTSNLGYIRTFKLVKDPKLRYSFSSHRNNSPQFQQMCEAEDSCGLVQYFFTICQHDVNSEQQRQLARQHLIAFSEEIAYRAAKERWYVYRDHNCPGNTWTEYVDIVHQLVTNVEELQAAYGRYQRVQPQEELTEFWQKHFHQRIRDLYFRQTGKGRNSPQASLKRMSRNQLRQALREQGWYDESKIERFLIIKECWFEVYTPSGYRYLPPKPEHYQAAAEFCTRHHFPITVEEFKDAIHTCLESSNVSIKIESFGEEEEMEASIFNSNSHESIAAWDLDQNLAMSDEKLQSYASEVNRVLVEVLEKLQREPQKQQDREMLLLRYGLRLSESMIAPWLKVNQSTVSRRCQKLKRQLLEDVALYLKEQVEIELEKLKTWEKYTEQWLAEQYREQIDGVIRQGFAECLSPDEQEILRAKFFQKLATPKVGRQRNLSSGEVDAVVTTAKHELLVYLLDWVTSTINISLDQERVQKKVAKVIESWLKNA